MAKLFHHLAIDKDVKGGYEKIRNETTKHFKRPDIFEGLDKEYFPREEGGQPLERAQKEVVSTVPERLKYTREKAVGFIDFELARDQTNMEARADLVVDGRVLAEKLPATFLLVLGKRLLEIRSYYELIPTLDLSKKWEETGRENVYRHGPTKSYRTAKKTYGITIAKATKEHPEQAKVVTEDVTVGHFDTIYFSGAVHARDKSRWMAKIDKLIEAVKQALQRANDIPLQDGEIGDVIFDFIHGE